MPERVYLADALTLSGCCGMLRRRAPVFTLLARRYFVVKQGRGGRGWRAALKVPLEMQGLLQVQGLQLVTRWVGCRRWGAGSRGVFGRTQPVSHFEVLLSTKRDGKWKMYSN